MGFHVICQDKSCCFAAPAIKEEIDYPGWVEPFTPELKYVSSGASMDTHNTLTMKHIPSAHSTIHTHGLTSIYIQHVYTHTPLVLSSVISYSSTVRKKMAHLEKENEILQGRLTQPGGEEDGKVMNGIWNVNGINNMNHQCSFTCENT